MEGTRKLKSAYFMKNYLFMLISSHYDNYTPQWKDFLSFLHNTDFYSTKCLNLHFQIPTPNILIDSKYNLLKHFDNYLKLSWLTDLDDVIFWWIWSASRLSYKILWQEVKMQENILTRSFMLKSMYDNSISFVWLQFMISYS